MNWDDPRLDRVWNQKQIPVIARGTTITPLLIKLPYGTITGSGFGTASVRDLLGCRTKGMGHPEGMV
jgi:hypothetical protein